jgi:L-rhamnose mutarotase
VVQNLNNTIILTRNAASSFFTKHALIYRNGFAVCCNLKFLNILQYALYIFEWKRYLYEQQGSKDFFNASVTVRTEESLYEWYHLYPYSMRNRVVFVVMKEDIFCVRYTGLKDIDIQHRYILYLSIQ